MGRESSGVDVLGGSHAGPRGEYPEPVNTEQIRERGAGQRGGERGRFARRMKIAAAGASALWALGVCTSAHAQMGNSSGGVYSEPPPQVGAPARYDEPRERFNRAVLNLKAAVSTPGATEADVRGAVERFRGLVVQMPGGISYLGKVQTLLRGLDAVMQGRDEQGTTDLSRIGPGATGAFVAKVEGPVLKFVPVPGVRAPELAFVRVGTASAGSGNAGGGGVYVQTTELSLGQFIGIVREFGVVSDVPVVLPRFDALTDPRRGPRVWTWPDRAGGGGGMIVPAPQWIPGVPEAGAPTLDSPMQQIGPSAALWVARLAGCRLPTSAEFAAATTQCATDVPRSALNLRDQSLLKSGLATWADAGALAPGGSFSETDDGVQLLAPVFVGGSAPGKSETAPGATGQVVHHLIGNVAEYVMDMPEADLPGPFASRVVESVRMNQGRIKVAGGSAFSDPASDLGGPVPIRVVEASEGYADVGMRLAFTVPTGLMATATLGQRVDRLLTPPPLIETR